MIRPVSVRPKPQNNYAKGLFFALLATAAAISVWYFSLDRYKGVVGMAALCVITAALFVYTKYISQQYIYDITEDYKGSPILVVRAVTGKRESTMCRVDLSSIISVEKESREQRKAHKTPTGYNKYVYSPTVMPDEVYRVTVSSRYEKAEIIIECSEEFASLLSAYANEARELYSSLEEE